MAQLYSSEEDFDTGMSAEAAQDYVTNYSPDTQNAYDAGLQSFDDASSMWEGFVNSASEISQSIESYTGGLSAENIESLSGNVSGSVSPATREMWARSGQSVDGTTEESSPVARLMKEAMDLYSSSSKATQGGIWGILQGAAKAYGDQDGKKALLKHYKNQDAVAQQRLALEQQGMNNKIAQQGSAATAWQGVKKPGLIGYQPLKINDISKRIV